MGRLSGNFKQQVLMGLTRLTYVYSIQVYLQLPAEQASSPGRRILCLLKCDMIAEIILRLQAFRRSDV